MSIKVENMLKNYDGSQDWLGWIEKFNTIAEFSGWDSDSMKAKFMLLFLEGTALRIVQQMPVTKRNSAEAIAERLGQAFKPSKMESHKRLIARSYKPAESVEGLWYDLVMLWKDSTGITDDVADTVVHKIILPFFLCALPERVSAQLRLKESSLMSADQLFVDARNLLVVEGEEVVGAVSQTTENKEGKKTGGKKQEKQPKCFKCGEHGHTNQACSYPTNVCWTCKKPGHTKGECRASGGGNGTSTKNLVAGKPWSGLLTGQ